MAWIRKSQATGIWHATVYSPNGRITKSHELRSVIAKWAHDLEADIRRGEFVDPRLADRTLTRCWDEYGGARKLELASRVRDASTWRCWVEPRWGTEPVGAILKPTAQKWVNELEEDGVGAWTIIAAINVLKAIMELAVDAGWIRANTVRRVKGPVPPAHVDRVIDGDEERAILARCEQLFPSRRDARPFFEGLLETGARWSELAAVRKEAVDLRNGLIALGPVMERDGTIRDYPKGARSRDSAGFRDAPIGEEYLQLIRPLVLATPPGGLLFTAPEGGSLRYPTWLDRVWNVVIHGRPARVLTRAPTGAYDAEVFGRWLDGQKQRAGLATDRELARAAGITPSLLANWRADRFGPTKSTATKLAAGLQLEPDDVYRATGLLVPAIEGAGLVDPQPTPHDKRHSYGTRMADAGLAMHDRMALMGHRDVRSAQRYTHSGETRFDAARKALKRARGG